MILDCRCCCKPSVSNSLFIGSTCL